MDVLMYDGFDKGFEVTEYSILIMLYHNGKRSFIGNAFKMDKCTIS